MDNSQKNDDSSQQHYNSTAVLSARPQSKIPTATRPYNHSTNPPQSQPSAQSRQREANTDSSDRLSSQIPTKTQISTSETAATDIANTNATNTVNKGRKLMIKKKYIQKKRLGNGRTAEELAREKHQKLKDINEFAHLIVYGNSFYDEKYEYRNVTLPKAIARWLPRPFNQLLKPEEWLSMGVQQSNTWEHYMIYAPEPHVLLFRRDKRIRLLKKQQQQQQQQQQKQQPAEEQKRDLNSTSEVNQSTSTALAASESQKPTNSSHHTSIAYQQTVLNDVNGPALKQPPERSSSNNSKYANKVRVFKPPSSAEDEEEEDTSNEEAEVDKQIASMGLVGETGVVANVSNMPPEPHHIRRGL